MKLLDQKVAIVTGGASGIGRACVELFVKEGAKVVITDLNENEGEKLADDLGENTFFIKADSSSAADNKMIVEKTVEKFGALHIAVNNAGISGESNTVSNMSPEGWNKVIAVNLNGVFYGMHYQIPEIKKVGGSIINMASILGAVGFENSAAYVAAKHGVIGLTKTAGWEYGTQGVRVNAVGPAFINTPLLEVLDSDTLNFLKSQHAFQRLGESNEVAELVLWLASDKSSFATGTYYPIDGGYLAK